MDKIEQRKILEDSLKDSLKKYNIRAPESFNDWDDTIFFAESDKKAVSIVCFESIEVGKIDTYIEPVNEFRDRELMVVEVSGDVCVVVDQIKLVVMKWFS